MNPTSYVFGKNVLIESVSYKDTKSFMIEFQTYIVAT